MALFLFGVSHRNASTAQREHLAVTNAELAAHLRALLGVAGVSEALLLSTCHRSEWVVEADDPAPVRDWLSGHYPAVSEPVGEICYVFQGIDAISHLVALGCGLDSMVLGEPEIFGQLKKAYAQAHALAAVGPQLRLLFPGVWAAVKKIRHQTQLGRHSLSMAQVVWQWAKQLFDDLSSCQLLCLGAGQMTAAVLRQAMAEGVRDITLLSRRLSSAQALAATLGAAPVVGNMADCAAALCEVDMVVAATGSAKVVLSEPMLRDAMRSRARRKPLLVVDLAMPRDVDPAVGALSDVYLHHLEDLQGVLAKHQGHRDQAAAGAQALLGPVVAALDAQLNVARAGRAIDVYRQSAERMRDERLAWARARLRRGDTPEVILDQLATQLTQKLLHQPTQDLRALAGAGDWESFQTLLKQLM